MSLCFDQAFEQWKASRIDEDEYLAHCLEHFAGVRHEGDKLPPRQPTSTQNNPVAEAIRFDALETKYQPLPDTSLLQTVFHHAAKNDVASLERTTAQHLRRYPSFPIPYQSLATYASSKGHGLTLQYCLAHGATLTSPNITWALETSSKDTVLLNLLYSSDWKDIKTSQSALNDLARSAFFHSAEEVTWFLSHGAETGILETDFWHSRIKADAVQAFLDHDKANVSKLKGSGMLQKAAEHGNVELARVLLEAGFDPNEILEARMWDRGEDPTLALRHAIVGGHEEVVRLLLKHGADPGLVGNAMGLARKYGNEAIVRMLEEYGRGKSKI